MHAGSAVISVEINKWSDSIDSLKKSTREGSNLSIETELINTYFQIQGSPANLDDQTIGVNLYRITELHPAWVGTGPGLPQAAPEDSAGNLRLHHLLDAANFDVMVTLN